MAVVNQVSDQLTLQDADKKLAANSEGKPFRRYFSITTLAGDATSVIRFVKIYKDERLMGGHIAAVICGAANATLALGITGSTSKFLAATAIDSALNADFNHTPALAFGELQTVDGEIIGTVGTAAALVNKVIAGYIDVQRSY